MEILQQSQCIVGSHFIWYSYTAIVSLIPGSMKTFWNTSYSWKTKRHLAQNRKIFQNRDMATPNITHFTIFRHISRYFKIMTVLWKNNVRGQLWSQKKSFGTKEEQWIRKATNTAGHCIYELSWRWCALSSIVYCVSPSKNILSPLRTITYCITPLSNRIDPISKHGFPFVLVSRWCTTLLYNKVFLLCTNARLP